MACCGPPVKAHEDRHASQEQGAVLEKELMERLYKLLAGGVRGTASGAFELNAPESPECTDSDAEQDGSAHADGSKGPGSQFDELLRLWRGVRVIRSGRIFSSASRLLLSGLTAALLPVAVLRSLVPLSLLIDT